jgi:hypothetical protein
MPIFGGEETKHHGILDLMKRLAIGSYARTLFYSDTPAEATRKMSF